MHFCVGSQGFDQLKKTKLQKKAVLVWKCQWLSGKSTSYLNGRMLVRIQPGHGSMIVAKGYKRSDGGDGFKLKRNWECTLKDRWIKKKVSLWSWDRGMSKSEKIQ